MYVWGAIGVAVGGYLIVRKLRQRAQERLEAVDDVTWEEFEAKNGEAEFKDPAYRDLTVDDVTFDEDIEVDV